MAWITPIVSWLANHIPTKDDFNRIEGNILHLNDNKVEKVPGKGLSEADYTTIEKSKLSGIESGATADMSANEILTALKTVDGAGSGLDADTLDGNNSAAFATANHGHSGYAPTSHKSTGTTYGVGDNDEYGHVKLLNALTRSSYAEGEGLTSYQGYLLNILASSKASIVQGTYTGTGAELTISLPFTPKLVILRRTNNNNIGFVTSSFNTFEVGASSNENNAEQVIVTNGFKLIATALFNGSGVLNEYIAIG